MDKPIGSYKYHKTCDLKRCEAHFKTNYKKKRFCQDDHRIEYHKIKLKKLKSLLERLEKTEKELKRARQKSKAAFSRATKEAQNLAALISSIKGGEIPTEKKKESNG